MIEIKSLTLRLKQNTSYNKIISAFLVGPNFYLQFRNIFTSTTKNLINKRL